MDLNEAEKAEISASINELYTLAEEVLAEFNRVEKINKLIREKLQRCIVLVNFIMEMIKPPLPVD